jgi:uncharacterized protein (DUF427 family)
METTVTTGRAGRVRVEQGAKRVRAYLGGEVVADTIRPRLVWEVPYYVVEDLAWSYRTTLPESQKIAGLVAFYNEEVDLFIDYQLQERPVTKFSRKVTQAPAQ